MEKETILYVNIYRNGHGIIFVTPHPTLEDADNSDKAVTENRIARKRLKFREGDLDE